MKKLLPYILSRLQERSTVGGIVAFLLASGTEDSIIAGVLALAGVAAAFIPGGK